MESPIMMLWQPVLLSSYDTTNLIMVIIQSEHSLLSVIPQQHIYTSAISAYSKIHQLSSIIIKRSLPLPHA